VKRLSARIGRQPAPAPYLFGPWYQPRRGDAFAELDRFLAADVPLTVAQTYMHYLPCGDQRGKEQAERERARRFHDAGLAITTYFNPMVCQDYEPVFGEAVSRGAFTKTQTGQPYLYRYTGSAQFFVGQFDFSSAAGREMFARLLGEALSHGHDGWMEDFGEYTPADSKSANGMDGTQMHNLYPVQYHCTAYDRVKDRPLPTARFIRSGWTGVAPCAQVVWNGDPTTAFGFDGLESAVRNGLTMGLSGISRWGSDIGGFFSLGSRRLTPELLIRWIEFGAVSGVMRTQANGFSLPDKPRPQLSDPEILPHWRRWAKLRTQLYPYISSADATYRRTGLPVMRHLSLVFPGDPKATGREDEYMFGPQLLAAPVVEEGATQRTVYLPGRRKWVDLWRSAHFDARRGRLVLGRPKLLDSGREATLPAPLSQLPLLARAGTVLALLRPEVETLAPYGAGERQTRRSDRPRRIDLLAFPRGTSGGRITPREGLSSQERRGRWRLTIRGRVKRAYRLQASLASLKKPFRPCRVALRGKRLPRRAWSYRRKTGRLVARFRVRSGTLVAAKRCGRPR
jgi:alpha-glucosidase (family GH31 glycosyl hydrolase)